MERTPTTDTSKFNFPLGFLWGSATASFQVEGGIENNDWSKAGREGRVPLCGNAVNHYNLFEEDFDIAKSLGQNAHRFSIEWSRIEPEEGKFDESEVEHYRKVISALKSRNIEPVVTLWHFTLPLWFVDQGGFAQKNAHLKFARYCEYVVGKLSGVSYYVTMNEPLIWASGGYFRGHWPPFEKNFISYFLIQRSLVLAHRKAYKVMKSIQPNLSIGIAKHNMHFDSNSAPWNVIAANLMRWIWNHRFLGKISKYQDFIGLNFYISKRFGGERDCLKSEMGWDLYPEGFYRVLMELRRYNKPVYVLENGIADKGDVYRAKYIASHVEALSKAMQGGVDVRGYFYWSLLDNYEWSFGFEKYFGLVEVDRTTMKRTLRPSALVYKSIVEKNKI
jgi:beta-glucosidase